MVTTSKAFSAESSQAIKPAFRSVNHQTDQNSLQQPQFSSSQQYLLQVGTPSSVGGNPMQGFQTMMMESPQTYVNDVKPSPGYMDADVQFNYPDDQYGQVKVEPQALDESYHQNPNALSNASAFQRQDSLLSTLMEVIADHDINDVSSTFSATAMSSQPNRTVKTHPINIQRQPTNHIPPFNQRSFESPTVAETHEANFTVGVPPASDTRKYNQFGVSPTDSCSANSPMEVMPFSLYQQNNVFASHSPECGMKMCPPNMAMTQSHSPQSDQMTMTFQATEDLMSPSQSVVSPCTWQQTQQVPEIHSAANKSEDVFVFDNFENQHFKPSQSCPNFNHGSNMNTDIPGCSGQNIELIPYPPKTHSNMSSVPSPSTPNSVYTFCGHTSDTTRLEEVDSVAFKELNLGRQLTEQERLDLKRIRNNVACQASRERRKKRKAEKEVQARNLEAENMALKQQIRKLEQDVQSAHERVKRRMSQS